MARPSTTIIKDPETATDTKPDVIRSAATPSRCARIPATSSPRAPLTDRERQAMLPRIGEAAAAGA
jgi:hypothetical protein